MKRNKKKIFAMLLFVFMSLFMFAFANPNGDIELDTLKPTITLNENNIYQMEVKTTIPEFKATAKDSLGEEIDVVIKHDINKDVVGKYKVTFTATDSFDNEEIIEREFSVVDTTRPVITLIGNANIKRVFGYETYIDQRANVFDNYDPTITINGVVRGNTTLPGIYTLNYNHTDLNGNIAFQRIRTIKLLGPKLDEDGDGYTNLEEYNDEKNYDDINNHPDYDKAPTITLNESNVYVMEVHTTIPTFNASATDVADGDVPVTITHNINKDVVGTYQVFFKAVDSLGNIKEIIKDFKVVDTTKPILSLIGENYIKIILGINPYTDEKAKATDNYDADVLVNGLLVGNSSILGEYKFEYNHSDLNGNKADEITRTIKVLAPGADEDEDGYTNEEEYNDEKDYDDVEEYPEYDKAPTITLDEENIYVMEVYSDIPTFTATATDVADGVVPVVITNNINKDVVGMYKVIFTATDSLGNIKTIEKPFEVVKRKITATIDDKTSVYGSPIVSLTYTVTSGTEVTPSAGIVLTKATGLNVGNYTITGTFTDTQYEVTFVDGNYEISAKPLTIDDLSGVLFNNKSFGYNGTSRKIEVTGLPAWASVSYNDNTRTYVGTQLVTATITGSPNYSGSVVMSANLKITKANIMIFAKPIVATYKEVEKPLLYGVLGTIYGTDDLNITLEKAPGTNAGVYEIKVMASNPNYQITLINSTYIIMPKKLTEDDLGDFSFTDANFVYNKSERKVVVTGLPTWASVNYNDNTRTIVGSQLVTATITGNSNYYGTIIKTATLRITKAPITVTIANKSSKYGSSIVGLTSSVTLGTLYAGDNLGITLKTTATSLSNVGTYPISGIFTNTNYNVTFVNGTYTITTKPITEVDLSSISFNSMTATYDKTLKTVLLTGVLPAGLVVNYTNNTRTVVGSQIATATITGLPNYSGSIIKTTPLEVTTAPVTVTIANKESVYGSSLVTLTSSVTLGNLYTGDNLGITLTKEAGLDVGIYSITGIFTNTNYNVTFVNGTYTITTKPITEVDLSSISFNSMTATYDKTLKTVLLTGVLPAGLVVNYTNNTRTVVGLQTATATITGANYSGSIIKTTTLEVTTAPVTVTAINKSSIYGSSLELLGYTTTGPVYGTDSLSIGLSTTATPTSTVGDYPIIVTASNPNYDITLINGTYTITPKALVKTDLGDFVFEDVKFPYDSTENKIEVIGLPTWASVSYNDNTRTDAGSQLVTTTITGLPNYSGSVTKTATLEVTKALVEVKADNKSSVYGSSLELLTSTISGTVYGTDSLSIGLSTIATTTSTVGNYPIIVTATNSNYAITLTNGTYTITPKPLTEADLGAFSFVNGTFGYDAIEKKIEVTGLPTWASVTYNDNTRTNVSSQTVLATITGLPNYSGIIVKSAILEITKAPLTITAVDKTSVYGSPIVPLTSTTTGTIYGSDFVLINLFKTVGSSVGTYTITPTASNSNYDITLINGTYTITPKTLTNDDLIGVVFNSKSFGYDAIEKKIEVTGLPTWTSVSYDDNTRTDSGSQLVTSTISGNSNYSGTVTKTATLTITKAPLTITADNKTSVYGSPLVELTSSITGTVYGTDTFGISLLKAPGLDTGTYTITPTASNSNYQLTLVNGTYEITPKTLTNDDLNGVTFNNGTFEYDATEHNIIVTGLPTWASVSYDDNTRTIAGSQLVTATISGSLNYSGSVTKTATLTITKANPLVNPIIGLSAIKGDLITSVLLPIGFTYKDPLIILNTAGDYVANVVFTPDDTTNYNIVETTATIYVKDIFTVTFKNDDVVHNTQFIVEGNNATTPTAPTKLNYTFAGWDKTYTNVMSDLIVNAIWTPVKYTITLVSGTGITSVIGAGDYDYNSSHTIDAVVASGYSFDSWTSSNTTLVPNSNNINYTFSMPAGNVTLTSSANIINYTINYELAGGNNSNENPTNYNVLTTNINFKAASKTNYTFVGWYRDSSYTNLITDLSSGSTGDITLYAKFIPNQTGIRTEIRDNAQLLFTQNISYNIKNYIDVYAKYADGTEVLVTDYNTNFTTVNTGIDIILNVTHNSFTDNTLKYTVIVDIAYQTKFELKAPIITNNGYWETTQSSCKNNCDVSPNITWIPKTTPIFEVIEHYVENISISNVSVKYVGESTYKTSTISNVVRWSRKTSEGWITTITWDPVRIVDFEIGKTIDKVSITYHRSGVGSFVIVFQYNPTTNEFKAISESHQ